MADDPEYVCALLTDDRGWLVLQLRPADARHAPDHLTCFGGAREPGESISACLRRELQEELAWDPGTAIDDAMPLGLDLLEHDRFIARFVPLRLPPGIRLRCEPGFHAIACPLPAIDGLPLSPWHRSIIMRWADQR